MQYLKEDTDIESYRNLIERLRLKKVILIRAEMYNSALLYCAEHHGITADRKTGITEVSTETTEMYTIGGEL